MATASLIVRISADINDFSRNLNKMTRDVDRAAKQVADAGKALTLGITLPVGLATIALGKMALENDAVAARMRGSFGPAVNQVNGFLEKLGKIVPVAGTQLQQLAVDVNNVATGLGMAGPKAALMTEGVLKMAANLSARTGRGFAEVAEAITKGLEGSTKSLKSMGVIIDDAQVKQEAFRLGLLKTGQTLTPLGEALATYSLLQQRTANYTGAAADIHQTAQQKFARFTTAATELADRLSNLLLPALAKLATFGSNVIDALGKIPDWAYKGAFAIGVFAAGIGPTITAVATLTAWITKLRTAFVLLTSAEMMTKIKDLFTIMKDPRILIATIALGAAIAGAIALWKKFTKEVEDTPTIEPPPVVTALLGGETATFTNEAQGLQQRANAVLKAFELAVHFGDRMQGQLASINALNEEAAKLYAAQADKMSEIALAAREVQQRTQAIIALQNVSRVSGRLGVTGAELAGSVRQAAGSITSPGEIKLGVLQQLVNTENDLRTREAAIQLPDTFDAVRVAALEMAEGVRAAQHDIGVRFAMLSRGLESMGIKFGKLSTTMQAVVVGLADAALQIGQQLVSRFSKGPNAAFGSGLLGTIGGALGASKLGATFGIFGGPIGALAGGLAGGLLGGLFDRKTKDAANALDSLARTTERVNEALSNLPRGFKIARARYLAETPKDTGGGGGTGGNGGTEILPGGGNASIVIQGDLYVNGASVSGAASLVRAVEKSSRANMNRGGSGLILAASRA